MKRTNIYLPEQMIQKLDHESLEKGESVAAIVRTAIESHQSADDREGGGYLCLLAMSFAQKQFTEKRKENIEEANISAQLMIEEAKKICVRYNLDDYIFDIICRLGDDLFIDYYKLMCAKNAEEKNRHIYIIKNKSTGNVKIGSSVDPKKRLKMHQCSNDGDLILDEYKTGTYQDETALQKMFKKDHITGEWFNDSKELRKAFKEI